MTAGIQHSLTCLFNRKLLYHILPILLPCLPLFPSLPLSSLSLLYSWSFLPTMGPHRADKLLRGSLRAERLTHSFLRPLRKEYG